MKMERAALAGIGAVLVLGSQAAIGDTYEYCPEGNTVCIVATRPVTGGQHVDWCTNQSSSHYNEIVAGVQDGVCPATGNIWLGNPDDGGAGATCLTCDQNNLSNPHPDFPSSAHQRGNPAWGATCDYVVIQATNDMADEDLGPGNEALEEAYDLLEGPHWGVHNNLWIVEADLRNGEDQFYIQPIVENDQLGWTYDRGRGSLHPQFIKNFGTATGPDKLFWAQRTPTTSLNPWAYWKLGIANITLNGSGVYVLSSVEDWFETTTGIYETHAAVRWKSGIFTLESFYFTHTGTGYGILDDEFVVTRLGTSNTEPTGAWSNLSVQPNEPSPGTPPNGSSDVAYIDPDPELSISGDDYDEHVTPTPDLNGYAFNSSRDPEFGLNNLWEYGDNIGSLAQELWVYYDSNFQRLTNYNDALHARFSEDPEYENYIPADSIRATAGDFAFGTPDPCDPESEEEDACEVEGQDGKTRLVEFVTTYVKKDYCEEYDDEMGTTACSDIAALSATCSSVCADDWCQLGAVSLLTLDRDMYP
ncbi:MAG: hypothetical protein H6923_06245 [Alphaproteobacteria bacterium]|nr:hypothetical protein [Alphaproteobacteria bacterium]